MRRAALRSSRLTMALLSAVAALAVAACSGS